MPKPSRAPTAIIENGKVVNGPELRRYWKERTERLAIIRRGMFQDKTEYPKPEPKQVIVEHVKLIRTREEPELYK